MKVGFTGSRKGMTNEQKEAVKSLIEALPAKEGHHGDCVGSDTDFHKLLVEYSIPIFIHPPIRNELRAFNEDGVIKQVFKKKEYITRNHCIVDKTQALIATPETEYEIQRSGTWATIRYGLKRKTKCYIVLPNGEIRV